MEFERLAEENLTDSEEEEEDETVESKDVEKAWKREEYEKIRL